MNNIFDALEICLQELEDGIEMEVVLGHFPDFSEELRPILETSIKARGMAAPAPSSDLVRRGRAKVMQHAAELREAKVKPQKRVIPIFQRLAISFGLVLLFLTSGTGLVNASSTALPGEGLYPVKRTWEDIRLLFVFDEHERNLLRYEFEDERLGEVDELLIEGRHEAIQIAGVFMEANGKTYVSGIQVFVPSNIVLPGNGTSVLLTGTTNADGFVEVNMIDLLPDGSVVPLGNPIEIETDEESEESSQPQVNEPQISKVKYFSMEGILQVINSTSLVVNDMTVLLDNPKIEGELCVGIRVELKGYFTPDGNFMVNEIESEGRCNSTSPSNNTNTNNNSNESPPANSNININSNTNDSDDNSNDNNNDNDDDNNNNDDDNSGSGGGNSGSGGGGDDNSNSGGGDDEPDDD